MALIPSRARNGIAATAAAFTIKRKDGEWALDVPLSRETIGELAIEAGFRGMGLVELIAQVLCEAVKKDMVGTILDGEERTRLTLSDRFVHRRSSARITSGKRGT